MVNGPELVFVERSGKLTKDDEVRFLDEDHVRRVIDKIVSEIGRRIDESTPMVDARLPDGSRVNAVIAPLAIGGPFLTIRKFSADPLQIDDLIRFGSVNAHAARFLQACIVGRLNGVVSGGTGTGKTTMLNVLSSFIPDDERIVTVEDAKELQLHQEHVLCMESRPPNVEGRGEVTIRDLVKNTLRMRPDRIVVGECRSGEALDMLQAMNTGHDGSLTTVHANSPRDTLARLETLVLMAGLRPAGAGHPRADGLGDRRDRAALPAAGRQPPCHAHHRGPGHGGRRDHPPGHLPVRLRRRRGRARQVPRSAEGHRRPAEVRREAGRPGHPARPRGVLARGRRAQGGEPAVSRDPRRHHRTSRPLRVWWSLTALALRPGDRCPSVSATSVRRRTRESDGSVITVDSVDATR